MPGHALTLSEMVIEVASLFAALRDSLGKGTEDTGARERQADRDLSFSSLGLRVWEHWWLIAAEGTSMSNWDPLS